EKLTVKNALELFAQYDVILDGTDNFATRYLINDACIIANKPLIYGAIYRFEGQVSVFNFNGGPSYRCLFPEPPPPGSVPSCSDIGVMGVLPGMIGTMQANEAIKMITGTGQVLSGKLLLVNALTTEFSSIKVMRVEQEVQAVLSNKDKFRETDYDFVCGTSGGGYVREISCAELKNMLLKNEDIQLIDVREPSELPKVEELKDVQIPLGRILEHADEIDRHKPVVIYCRSGARSALAVTSLTKAHGFTNLLSLKGGVLQWMAENGGGQTI
ncbi:MAG: ThiF family adenylyltransferase, partial [Flavobacteriales bacterium]